MERIIKKWELFIGYGIIHAYYLGVSLIHIGNRTYTIDENVTASMKSFINHIYIGIWIIYILALIREYMLHRRIYRHKVTLLYYPSIKLQFIKMSIVLLCHITYWVLVNKGIYAVIPVTLFIILILTPAIKIKAVFETDHYIICSGIKLYYHKIDSFRDDFAYKISVILDEKEIEIQCGNEKRYDLFIEKLSNHGVCRNCTT